MVAERIIPGDIFLDTGVNDLIRKMCQDAETQAAESFGCIRQQQLYVSVVPVRYLKCVSGKSEFNVTVYDHDRKLICNDFPTIFGSLFKRS